MIETCSEDDFILHASDQEAVNTQDTVRNNQGLIYPEKVPQSIVTEDNNSSKNLSHSYEEVEEKGNPVTVCDKEGRVDMIPPEDRPAQHRPFQVGQIFTLIGFGPANCSQIFDGYEFTSKISRQI